MFFSENNGCFEVQKDKVTRVMANVLRRIKRHRISLYKKEIIKELNRFWIFKAKNIKNAGKRVRLSSVGSIISWKYSRWREELTALKILSACKLSHKNTVCLSSDQAFFVYENSF